MRRLLSILTVGLCAAAGNAARAETLAPMQPLNSAPGILRYVLSQSFLTDANRHAIAQDRTFGIACQGQYALEVKELFVLATIEMPPGADRPATGVWRLGYDVTRCETVKRYNLLYRALPNGVTRTTMAPGRSIADIQLQLDAWGMALVNLRTMRPDCPQPAILDTQLNGGMPRPGDPWREKWTVVGCGPQVDLDMRFTPSPQGGTGFAVGMPAR